MFIDGNDSDVDAYHTIDQWFLVVGIISYSTIYQMLVFYTKAHYK